MAANLTGIVSGLDSSKIIEATMASKRRPVVRLEGLVKGVDAKISAVSDIQSQLKKLEEQMDKMEDISDVLSLSGKVGSGSEDDEGLDVINISATGEASEGSYEVTVTSMASPEKMRSDSTYDTKNSEVKAGSLEITLDGETDDTVTIIIEQGDTVSSIADKINASDAAVNASLIFDGSDYRLQIVAEETGYTTGTASEALVITESYTGASGSQLNLSEIGVATNAVVNIDGLDMEFQDNSLDEVLEGVTIDLKGVGTTSFTIANDKTGTKENIEAFIEFYNETIAVIKKHLTVTENSDRNSSLNGDSSIGNLKNKIQDIIGAAVSGVDGTYSALAHIGITTEASGKLSIDSDDLDEAMDKDLKSIGQLFATDDTGMTDKLQTLTELYADSLEGLLKEKKDSLSDQKSYYQDRIDSIEVRLESIEQRLMRKFSDMEVAISMLQAQGQSLSGLGSA
jgi:flagellar hook-associated protein 2